MHIYSKGYHGISNSQGQHVKSVYTAYYCVPAAWLQSIAFFFNTQFGAPLTTGPGKLFLLKFKAMHYPEVVGITNNFLSGSSEMGIQY